MAHRKAPHEIWLVRHGPVDVQDGTCLGWTDVPLLDPERTRQGSITLARRIGDAEAVYSSDLSRAVDTARPLAEEIGTEMIATDTLREMNFGRWEMKSWRDLVESKDEHFALFVKAWFQVATPDGESYADMTARVQKFWKHVELSHVGATVVIVAHGGSLAVLSTILLNWHAKDAMKNMLDRGHAGYINLTNASHEWNIDPFA